MIAKIRQNYLKGNAVNGSVKFGIQEMKLNGGIALTKPENEKAIALLSRNGFCRQARLTEGYLKFVYSQE